MLLAANKDKEWGMFERWIILLLLLRGKRVLLSPMTERKVVCGKQRPAECSPWRHEQKAVATVFAVPGALVLSRDERT